jgi:alpha-tubulin suppressor-like RCC1 family protein
MLRHNHPFVCRSGRVARSALTHAWLTLAGASLAFGCAVDARDVGVPSAGGSAGDGAATAGGAGDMNAAFSPDGGLVPPPPDAPCDAGLTCSGDRLIECDAGVLIERQVCAQGCVSTRDGARCSGGCVPTSRACLPGEVPALCDEQGTLQPGAPCAGETPVCLPETGTCAPCRPGEQRACDPGAGACTEGTETCELVGTQARFGACVARDASDGTPCDDGDARTVLDSCRQATCTGAVTGQLATGPRMSCAIRSGGAVYCWGDLSNAIAGLGLAPPTLIELPLPAASVSVGDTHACAVLADDSVRCWGGNGLGTLGNGTDQPVTGTALVPLAGVLQVAAGSAHSAAVTDDGSAFVWGDYTRALGQTELFGPGAPAPESGVVASPLQIAELGQVSQLGLGFRHVCAALGSGQVVCWGRNDFSQLGRASLGANDAQAFTALVPNIDDAVGVACGDSYSCALRGTGAVVCWGSLFTSDLNGTVNLAPAEVPELADAVQLGVGSSSACALRRDGTVACWGGNAFGELGTGSFNGTLIPQTVVELDGSPLRDVALLSTTGASGGRSMCARRRSGRIACWGANDAQQLADGTTTHRSRPVDVADLPD